MKKYEKIALVLLLLLSIGAVFAACFGAFQSNPNAGKFFQTAGSLLAISAIVQLEVSGFFDNMISHYSDETDYPYGPPSFITREIIDNPDTPIENWIRNFLFFDIKTGAKIGIVSAILGIFGTWF